MECIIIYHQKCELCQPLHKGLILCHEVLFKVYSALDMYILLSSNYK